MPEKEDLKTIEEVSAEIDEYVKKVIGKINSFDSRTTRATVTQQVLTQVIAGAELSRIEKVGILMYVLNGRIK